MAVSILHLDGTDGDGSLGGHNVDLRGKPNRLCGSGFTFHIGLRGDHLQILAKNRYMEGVFRCQSTGDFLLLQRLTLAVIQSIADPGPVKVPGFPVISVILIDQVSVSRAQIFGSIDPCRFRCVAVSMAFQPFLIFFFYPGSVELRQQDQGSTAGHRSQNRGGTEDYGNKFEKCAVAHGLPASFHFVALTPHHFQVAGLRGIDLDFFPQMADMHRHGAFAA